MIDTDIGPSLAFIGFSRPAFGAVPPLSEMSARLWALLLTGERDMTGAKQERDEHRAYEERLFDRDGATKLTTLVQYQRQMDAIARRIDCMPPIELLKLNHPVVYERVIGSCFSGAQFRLRGDGATEAAWKHVAGLPLPKFKRESSRALRQLINDFGARDK